MSSHLDRFVEAQRGVFEQAIEEIAAGNKRTHWMWFIFPQLRGLGQSHRSMLYGISDLDEAKRYMAHPVLGYRLREATRCVLDGSTSASKIFGEVDFQKFVSCMTLFSLASPPGSIFHRGLRDLSVCDEATVKMIGGNHDGV
jgi:uncharacterized protein (DUF1810 family)